ncbi:MAG TPA: carboxypeptidase-like regulatory domain-containing protein [Bacteroidales bacterium]|nr:carboxypeptidase-like regulatory domain-containing protein [Bacteroidales bacterium]
MKTFRFFSLIAVVMISLLTMEAAIAANSDGKKKVNPQDLITIRGKIIDSQTRTALVFASVMVKESNVGIVTNIDGEFTLKVSPSALNLEISYLGYKNLTIPISSLKENGGKNTIEMESAPIPIKEIIVKPVDPQAVVYRAIININKNYESAPNLMTAFYREAIRKNRSYVSIGEAVVEIFKAPYANDLRYDGTRIYKGRKSADVEKMDTILFKLQGGPVTVLQLDIIKNTESILTMDAMEYYDYMISGVIEIDGKPHYIIDFKQKPSVDHPLFMGSFFINMETYAITEAEFGFNLENKEAAASIFIKKKPLGMKVYPEVATYRTKYREQDGKLHFIYSRAEVKFKVDWSKKLFHTFYTTMSEIAVTDRTDQEVIKFAREEKIKYNDVFSEKVSDFADVEFWGDYNVIEPDQSIETAIRRLSRKLKFSDREE